MTDRSRSALVTGATAVVITVLLMVLHMGFDPAAMASSRQPVASMAEVPEYAELLESLNSPAPSDPSAAHTATPEHGAATPVPEGGADMADAGLAAPPPAETTAPTPAPVSRQERTVPPQTGPTQQQREQQRAQRRAQRDIANAFSNPGTNNTSSPGTTPGNAGNPDGADSPVNGSGQGTVGGGWIMPAYAKIPSTLTGSIRLKATINASGAVVEVIQIGGESPASTDTRLVQRCMAEVRSRRYSRTDNAAPTSATAFVTYIFK